MNMLSYNSNKHVKEER